jgi:hypothetical protein
MQHLPASEEDRELHAVPFLQECPGVADLDLQVVTVGFRSKSDFFQRCARVLGLLVGFANAPLLLVQPFAVIHDPADRRHTVRRDLDQVQTRLLGFVQSFRPRNDTDLIVCLIHEPNLIGSNRRVDTQTSFHCCAPPCLSYKNSKNVPAAECTTFSALFGASKS